MDEFELETWIIETGHEVIEKRATLGVEFLTPREKLIYCLWVADYGMRNAGDLDAATNMYESFQTDGAKLASELELKNTLAAFSLSKFALQERYFTLLDGIIREINTN